MAPVATGGMSLQTFNLRAWFGQPRVAALAVAVGVVAACSPTVAPAPSAALIPAASPSGIASPAPSAPESAGASPATSASASTAKITPIAGAPDSKVVVHLAIGSAHKVGTTLTLWDRIAITAPADKVWHISIDNQETGVLHNFTIASGPTLGERIIQTTNFLKGVHAYDVAGLQAGSYLFICTLHANVMTGTLTLE